MKKIILSALAVLPFAAFAQNSFTIKGEGKALKTGDKIYLVYAENGARKTDSAIVSNQSFSFKGEIENITMGNLFRNVNPYVKGSNKANLDFTALYIEPGNIVVSTVDSLKSAKFSGTPVNVDNAKLSALLKPFTDEQNAINEEYSKYTDEQKGDKQRIAVLSERMEKATEGMYPIYLDFASKNSNSYLSLASLARLAGEATYISKAEAAFLKLNPALRTSPTGEALAMTFEAGRKTGIGAMAMDFTQNDPNGKPVKLSDFKGKYVLLDFWASWCGPCREENPNVVLAFNKFKDKNFTILGVSLDQPTGKQAWLKAIADDQLTWTQVSDLKFWNNEVSKAWGIRSIPANFLIDPTGKIIAKDLRGEELQTKLAELLGNKTK